MARNPGVSVGGPSALESTERDGPTTESLVTVAGVELCRTRLWPGASSGWHHRGDTHVFGYVVEGEGYVEWGTGPDDRALVRAGEWFHLSPGVVHRDVNPRDADQRYLLWLTGSEPRTVPAAGPPRE
jgi:quercetin dioxygenase-like cupin family protein